jgi:hypothetical protein
MTVRTPSHLSLCNPGGGVGQRHSPMFESLSGNACGIKGVGQCVLLSNNWELIRGISYSHMQRFQEMLCIETRRHKLRSFADHH